ncbi:DUF3566 domain-containing protein [Mycobacterium xenopi]|uniref:DUF3566 domain-containing protein n=2 Tax=Mycobacterium xenopi TaxID=1789 RepID=A0AAD1GVW8_MYCXE|nr:DUF3566 domain-containing protein [Mycobacterium xenopi]MDA3638712.1 DUF3566 domain-containing protein [Mycobacterium xenopi]MDA3656939.1 DUF3566 domain-containing protein [Mycobacterium xenopi]MDA3663209.1 DUF3566 domain-containing protein [Mycobacterium xenopi]ORX10761.1 hypothetical protein AWC32_17085 [Mycobacterium xenopi]SPX94316.1 putative conserved membrane protein [Mycobacterium xenopi]
MTSPNEPGYPSPGDNPGERNGSPDRGGAHRPAPPGAGPGRVPDVSDGRQWPRRPERPRPPQRSTPATSPNAEPRSSGHSGEVGARLNRFITGTAAPAAFAAPRPEPARPEHSSAPVHDADPAPVHEDGRHGDAYLSELPDLSGPSPRPGQRKPASEHPTDASPSPGPGRPTGPEPRLHVARRPRGPVRASMQIRRIDPWSTLKVSLVLSVTLFFVWMIAVAFLYLVLGGMGVWSKLNSNVGDLLTNAGGGNTGELVSSGTIFGGAALIGLVNIVLLTAMATVGAFIYNLTTDLIGGIEVTLADRD